MKRAKKRAITRRQFVKGTIGLGVAAAASGCSSVPGFRKLASVDEVETQYDYIVIGSGAGGGPVACNLAEAGKLVLLIEAGDTNDKNRNYDVPAFHPRAVDDPRTQWNFFVNHYADQVERQKNPQTQDWKWVDGKGVLYPRAGTVGGCTAHHALVTLYPDNKDWDDIAKTFPDDPKWNSFNMRSYYQRLENLHGLSFPAERRGDSGWLGVEQTKVMALLRNWDRQLFTIAAAGAGAKTPNDLEDVEKLLTNVRDPNNWTYVINKTERGAFNIPKSTTNAHRFGIRERILRLRDQHNKLILATNCLVTRVVLEGSENRAIGVEFLDGAHIYKADPATTDESVRSAIPRTAKLRRDANGRVIGEVIVAGGTFNSPQILMLSGIGPGDQLSAHNIAPRLELNGVGRNLQDRYEIGMVSKLKNSYASLVNCTYGKPGDPCLTKFDAYPEGSMYSSNGPITALLRRSDPSKVNPDLCIFAIPGLFRGYYPHWSDDSFQSNYLTWAVLKGQVHNPDGRVTLQSANPWDTPVINFNWPEDPNNADFKALVKGVEVARSVNRVGMVNNLIEGEELPGKNTEQFVRNEAWGHHASCTNRMGQRSDANAVVDGQFRVHGTKGLRVVDASVFPRIPGLFIVVPVFMIAEKASDDILADYGKV